MPLPIPAALPKVGAVESGLPRDGGVARFFVFVLDLMKDLMKELQLDLMKELMLDLMKELRKEYRCSSHWSGVQRCR